MYRIDGSLGSGSGTLVRLALAIAALTETPLVIENVREHRDPPGLRPQHVTAAEAIKEMSGGSLEGAEASSRRLCFHPGGRITGGQYAWDIGSAGSTTLLASALLPLAAFADSPCHFRITGGLFQDFAPSAFHLQYCLLPLLARTGLRSHLEIVRPGYVPKGGGILEIETQQVTERLRSLSLNQRAERFEVWGIALASHLQRKRVGDRMAESCARYLQRRGYIPDFRIIDDHTAAQPGAALFLVAEDSQGSTLGSDRAGAIRRRSESMGEYVARQLWKDLKSGATVDRHLADQIVLFAALADGVSQFVVPRKTDHLETNLMLVQQLLGAEWKLENQLVTIRGIGFQ